MAFSFTTNILKQNQNHGYLGGFLWNIKETLVDSGLWEVRGSGDGNSIFAYNGVTAALDPADQGSGGDYDCLKTPQFEQTAVKQNGYFQSSAWCVLRQVGGQREWLFCNTDQTSGGWWGYGRIAYNAGLGATAFFDGSTAGHSTIPGAATDEQWIFGNRATSTGVQVITFQGAAVHVFADQALESTVAGWGAIWIGPQNRSVGGVIFCPVHEAPSWDNDPAIVVYGSSGLTTVQAWNQYSTANQVWQSVTLEDCRYNATRAFNSDNTIGIKSILARIGSAPDQYYKGWTGRCYKRLSSFLDAPMIVTRGSGGTKERFIVAGSSTQAGYCVPWPTTDPLPVSR